MFSVGFPSKDEHLNNGLEDLSVHRKVPLSLQLTNTFLLWEDHLSLRWAGERYARALEGEEGRILAISGVSYVSSVLAGEARAPCDLVDFSTLLR